MLAYLLLFAALVWAAAEDVRRRIIPDTVHVLILISGLLFIFVYHQPWVTRLIAFLAVSGLLLLAILLTDFAGGDVKLIASLSFALGLLPGLLSLMAGFLLAAVYLLLQKRKSNGVPLAPFILAGCLTTLAAQKMI